MTGYDVNTWIGFFAPADAPSDARAKLEEAIKEAVAMPDVRARFASLAMNVRSGTADNCIERVIGKWEMFYVSFTKIDARVQSLGQFYHPR